MFKLKKLYSSPEVFDAISFESGVNLILGVESEDSNKTNGVGKSMSIEFLNFALLTRKTQSRVALIPEQVLPQSTLVCVDFEIAGESYTLKRSVEKSEEPTIETEGKLIEFSQLSDATQFLTEKLFGRSAAGKSPSFRSVLGPLIRDERSEFKSLISCYDTKARATDNYAPHLYFFGIDILCYQAVRNAISSIDDINKSLKKIREDVRLVRQKEIEDARSDLNELDSEVLEIEKGIDALENVAGFDIVKDDLVELEVQLDDFRRERSLLLQKLKKTKLVADAEKVDVSEVSDFFSQLSERLGEIVQKDLEEVFAFKAKIDDFQSQLIQERRNTIESRVENLNGDIRALDKQYSEKLKILDQQGSLKSLKQTYAAFQVKSNEAGQLRAFIGQFEELENKKLREKSKKEAELLQFQANIHASKEEILSFEQTVLDIHEYIQGNRKASFKISPTAKKQVVEITMRIDADGSHSIDREKVFIYDLSLLLNEYTASRHPSLLVHDNIFDVDQDTLLKSLKYILEAAAFGPNKQYILTLNSDRLNDTDKEKLHPYVRAEFTKDNRFLKVEYQQK